MTHAPPSAPRHRLALLLPLALAACSMAEPATSASDSRGDTGLASTSTTTDATDATGTAATTDAATSGTGDACGNGALDPGEVCDGAELGGQTCAGLGAPYIGGDLACAADCAAVDASACTVAEDAPQVRLNEILAKGASAGEYADMGDLIELVNIGGAPADLGGWRISDDPGFAADKTYTFPPGTTLAPGAFLVLVEYDPMTGDGDLPFGVSASNPETLVLANTESVLVDGLDFEGSAAVPSLCRLPDGTGDWQACAETPGAANHEPGGGETCGDGVKDGAEACDGDDLGGQTCADVGDFVDGDLACTAACALDTSACVEPLMVAVNELSSSDLDPIELHNADAAPVDISGWILTDDPTDPYDPDADTEELVFPPGTVLAAGAFLVVEKGIDPLQHPFGLAAAGDTVRLFDAALTPTDAVTYPADAAATSYCRAPDGPGGVWTAECKPTFGASNEP